MAKAPRKTPKWDYANPMVGYPDHVHALGMLVIEYAQMEVHFSLILSSVLELPAVVGHTIFFTPQASKSRIEMVQNVAEHLLKEKSKFRNQIVNLVKRGIAVMDKRHRHIHDLWFNTDDGGVIQIRLPKRVRRSVELKDIEDVVETIRSIIVDTNEFLDQWRAVEGEPSPWPDK